MFRPCLGAVIIADRELVPSTETATFKDIEFFCRCVTVRRIARTWSNAHKGGHPARNRIVGEQLRNHTRSDGEPIPFRGFHEGEPLR